MIGHKRPFEFVVPNNTNDCAQRSPPVIRYYFLQSKADPYFMILFQNFEYQCIVLL